MNHEQPLRKIPVELAELCAAVDDASLEHRYFLDTETGEVILISEVSDGDEVQQQLGEIDEAESGHYLEVPRADSHEGYRDLEDFILTVQDQPLRELLEVAIQGRGAFRRFKDVLARNPAELQRWFDFQGARIEARAREWLTDEGCEPVSLRTRV